MVNTIGNPLTWGVRRAAAAGTHLVHVGENVAGADAEPQVRRITVDDLKTSLRKGVADFALFRTDVAVLCVFYPIIGALLVWVAFDRNLLPLLFPMASGFALVGPVAAVGMYELSRKHELGQKPSWADALGVVRAPAFGAIFVLGLLLFGLFVLWLITAQVIYSQTMGPEVPLSAMAFVRDVLGTTGGRWMIVLGMGVGFVFAAAVLSVTLVSFPLLLDRNVGLPVAVVTSLRVTRQNPGTVALWGLIVAAMLVLGSIPLFLGLIVVMPILGHATWHLYRAAVVPI